MQLELDPNESSRLQKQNHLYNTNEEIIGYNKYSDEINIPKVKDEIYRSLSKRYYIIFDEKNIPKSEEELISFTKIFGINKVITVCNDNIEHVTNDENSITQNTMLFFSDLGFAITSLEDSQIELVELQENSFKIEPEYQISTCETRESEEKVNNTTLSTSIDIRNKKEFVGGISDPDLSDSTIKNIEYKWHWGIHRINAHLCINRGSGINVAILDTGFNINHPDYKYRNITTHTYVGENAQDGSGHGTHCIGIACGNEDINGIRYGVAFQSNIFACKVLDNDGKGFENNLILGIKWAVKHKCKVISISIEFVNNGTKLYSESFNRTVRYARVEKNCIIVAAAGNSSNRPYTLNALGCPADLPFVLAVSAINKNNKIYKHSNRADNVLSQQMNFTAPGVDIYSSWSLVGKPNLQNRIISGTSMAAPFIAGIIALLWENHKDDATVSYRTILVELENLCEANDFNWSREDVGLGIPLTPIPN